MAANRNPNVVDLLSWHGHDKGGVRVPFGEFGLPLKRTVETGILTKLREAATNIASGRASPRWIFLVGGPGNGKSQMVEEFVRTLDTHLNCDGRLVVVVTSEFQRVPTPRRVEVPANGTSVDLGDKFGAAVYRLVIIQDASASDRADQDAAEQLDEDLLNLLTEPRSSGVPAPVVLCCINRGLLARALMVHGIGEEVVDLLEALTRATGLGEEALEAQRPRCWPVEAPKLVKTFPELEDVAACWPMDVESLLAGYDSMEVPVASILQEAVADSRWEEAGCGDCDHRCECPLYQNAKWLRTPEQSTALLRILRRQELATGQRWNFRSAFSLIAELLVGEWEDFSADGDETEHPCVWVHETVQRAHGDQPQTSVPAFFDLVQRLYPQALFVGALPTPSKETQEFADSLPYAEAVVTYAASHRVAQGRFIRRHLEDSVLPVIDPAKWSPEGDLDGLDAIEDGYSQSVILGNEKWPAATSKAAAEEHLLGLLAKAEEECDQAGSDRPSQALGAEKFIRQMAATLAKRSVAIRLGHHGQESHLTAYESAIRDVDALADVQRNLRVLLNHQGFYVNALATLGQAESLSQSLIRLTSTPVQVFPIRRAPDAGAGMPAHDIPAIPIASRHIPLTYDLFLALRLRSLGCSSASMPASVRASLDLMQQLYAGEVCRSQARFLAGDSYFEVVGRGHLTLATPGGTLQFRTHDGR